MYEEFGDAPMEGQTVDLDEIAQATENRIYIYVPGTNTLIGHAEHLKREPTSSVKWLLVGICTIRGLQGEIEIRVEQWKMNQNIFHEGYGWMTHTSHTEPEDITLCKTFQVTRVDAVPASGLGEFNLYRYATLEERKNP